MEPNRLMELYINQIGRINGMEQKKLITSEEAKRYEKVVQQQIFALTNYKIKLNDFQDPQPTREVDRAPNAPFVQLTTDELNQIVNGNQMLFQDYLETRAGNALDSEGIGREIENYKSRDTADKMLKLLKLIIGNIYEKEMNNVIEENRPLLTNDNLRNSIADKKAIIKRFKNTRTPASFPKKLNELNKRFSNWQNNVDAITQDQNLSILFGDGLYGNGMILKHLKSRRVRIGGGIDRQERPLYQKLGRYIIHVPSLTKNVLNIKYPSMVSIKSLPKRPISTMIKNLIFEMLDNQDFSKKYYNVLDEEEQDLIRDVLYQAEIGEKFGFGLKDTPYSTIIDRFNLLKSQVIAGNNNKEVIRELKQLTSKLVDKSVLNKGDGFELLKLIDAI